MRKRKMECLLIVFPRNDKILIGRLDDGMIINV
jgi:hypothetical protein